eukprot:TRINITY_DN1923_c0_g2_i1.p1 TRINITY_DN1923_c0_g2~~TRINITY_DN1923_c0_g2_i1.p1  ORF type:complete len:453 (-),score=78.53 TRINITY_DN1923_c0_g2_i1:83-1441(-)
MLKSLWVIMTSLKVRSQKRVPQVDKDSVKRHWFDLSFAEKTKVLRFEERALADLFYHAQQELFAADLACLTLGMGHVEKVRRDAGSDYFDIEGIVTSKGLQPVAFFAKQEFVVRADIFEFIEMKLCRPFLGGSTHSVRRSWASLFKKQPSSWSEFAGIALSIVEQAIIESAQASLHGNEHADGGELEALEDVQEASNGRSAKRRARKKRAAQNRNASEVAAASSSFDVCSDVATDEVSALRCDALRTTSLADGTVSQRVSPHASLPSEAGTADASQQVACDPLPSSLAAASVDPIGLASDAAAATDVMSTAHIDSTHPEGTRSPSYAESAARREVPRLENAASPLVMHQVSRHSAREAWIGASVTPALIASQASRASAAEARIAAEMKARNSRGRPGAPWLLADGSSGEHWVDGYRTVVKNTFLDMEDLEEPKETSCVRARSLPCSFIFFSL